MNAFSSVLLSVSVSSFLVVLDCGASSPPLVTAVLPFTAQGDELNAKAQSVTSLIEASLATAESMQLVERSDIEKILKETEAALAGTVDPANAPQIGRMTGAKVIVTGRCIAADGGMVVVAKAISTETSRMFATKLSVASTDKLETACAKLADDVAKLIEAHRADLVAVVETPEQRLDRLRKLLPAGLVLPTVLINVKEEHLTQRVPDPAVQTEIQHTLQALGFPLVSEVSKSQWQIDGEAFSERGLQRGSLVSCRARAELKIQKAGSDKLMVDRQTTVAMDLAEHIAAKSALQNAGAALAERLVAMLVK